MSRRWAAPIKAVTHTPLALTIRQAHKADQPPSDDFVEIFKAVLATEDDKYKQAVARKEIRDGQYPAKLLYLMTERWGA